MRGPDCGTAGLLPWGTPPRQTRSPRLRPYLPRSYELPEVAAPHRNWRWRCTRAFREALETGKISREAHAAIFAILDHSDGRGKDCWPGLETLGTELGGIAERTVCRHLAELRAKGWLAVKHRHRITADGIKGRSNIYRPLPPGDAAMAGAPQPQQARNERRHPSPAPSPVPAEVGSALEVIARWVAALEAMTPDQVATLAAKHLPGIVAKRPGHARTQSLAYALAQAEGPP